MSIMRIRVMGVRMRSERLVRDTCVLRALIVTVAVVFVVFELLDVER